MQLPQYDVEGKYVPRVGDQWRWHTKECGVFRAVIHAVQLEPNAVGAYTPITEPLHLLFLLK